MKTKIYAYPTCDSCKKALRYLEARKIPFEKIAIVENPPSVSELRKMLKFLGGDLKKLFNTSGQVYREMKLGEKLPKMSVDEALQLLAKSGKLIKRPFVCREEQGIVGFKEADWDRFFSQK